MQPTLPQEEGQAQADFHQARADFNRLAELAYVQHNAVETAQFAVETAKQKLTTTQAALDNACI